jgi:hypothetical protein
MSTVPLKKAGIIFVGKQGVVPLNGHRLKRFLQVITGLLRNRIGISNKPCGYNPNRGQDQLLRGSPSTAPKQLKTALKQSINCFKSIKNRVKNPKEDKNDKAQEGSRPKRPIRERLPYEDHIAPDEARTLSAADKIVEKALKDAEQSDMEVRTMTSEIEGLMNDFIADYDVGTNLSGKERMRLFGAGVRNFGFIEKQ